MKLSILRKLVASRAERRPFALLTDMVSGAQWLVFAAGDAYGGDAGQTEPSGEIVATARRFLQEQRSSVADMAGSRYLVQVHAPPARLLVVGAVHIAQALLPMAELAGFRVFLIDPREAFSAPERFPGIEMIRDWPDLGLETLSPDVSTAVVTLSHDPKIDDPALRVALASDAFYIGALGSRKTHAARLKRLSAMGIADEALERIHAPVGLKLGGRKPAEIAISILAQIVEARYRRHG